MPVQVRNSVSGALIFHQTSDEQERVDMKKENKELHNKVQKLEKQMTELKKSINNIRGT